MESMKETFNLVDTESKIKSEPDIFIENEYDFINLIIIISKLRVDYRLGKLLALLSQYKEGKKEAKKNIEMFLEKNFNLNAKVVQYVIKGLEKINNK